jgi:hypothetical protein
MLGGGRHHSRPSEKYFVTIRAFTSDWSERSSKNFFAFICDQPPPAVASALRQSGTKREQNQHL